MLRCKTLCIAACWLLASAGPRASPDGRRHRAGLSAASPATLRRRRGAAGPMATRAAERAFAQSRLRRRRATASSSRPARGCHVSGCSDCHGGAPHRAAGRRTRPASAATGATSSAGTTYGRAPREDHARYRRGPMADGERYLKMLPDVHPSAA